MKAYDGNKRYSLEPGDQYIARKNHLIRYVKSEKFDENNEFEKIIITLDEPFLKQFLEYHPCAVKALDYGDSFLFIKPNKLFKSFIKSLEPYYTGNLDLDATFSDVKREELMLILLRLEPYLSDVLFNFGIPGKIDLEDYMNRNFRFNLSLERFAFLTGRSLSSFKRDFQKTFGATPGIWLKKKRLDEAYFQISKQNQKSNDVYLEVGFEDLSHFSFVFKKEFGKTPSEVAAGVI
jgi:AraC-like DNA-binding protein